MNIRVTVMVRVTVRVKVMVRVTIMVTVKVTVMVGVMVRVTVMVMVRAKVMVRVRSQCASLPDRLPVLILAQKSPSTLRQDFLRISPTKNSPNHRTCW